MNNFDLSEYTGVSVLFCLLIIPSQTHVIVTFP